MQDKRICHAPAPWSYFEECNRPQNPVIFKITHLARTRSLSDSWHVNKLLSPGLSRVPNVRDAGHPRLRGFRPGGPLPPAPLPFRDCLAEDRQTGKGGTPVLRPPPAAPPGPAPAAARPERAAPRPAPGARPRRAGAPLLRPRRKAAGGGQGGRRRGGVCAGAGGREARRGVPLEAARRAPAAQEDRVVVPSPPGRCRKR